MCLNIVLFIFLRLCCLLPQYLADPSSTIACMHMRANIMSIHLNLSHRDTSDRKHFSCIFSKMQQWHDKCGSWIGIRQSENEGRRQLKRTLVENLCAGVSRIKTVLVLALTCYWDYFHSCSIHSFHVYFPGSSWRTTTWRKKVVEIYETNYISVKLQITQLNIICKLRKCVT